jgi:hypothetical protein
MILGSYVVTWADSHALERSSKAAASTSAGSGCSGTFVPCSPMTISLRQSPSGH